MARIRFGTFLAPHHPVGEHPTLQFQRDLGLAEHLDKLGFDEFWCGEHHSSGWEMIASPELFLAIASERTKRIRLGTGVVSLPYHHPFNVAQRIVQLDHMTFGRVIFGTGPGALPSDARTFGIDYMLLRDRQDEAIGILKRLFAGERITYKGEWFQLNEAQLQILPYQEDLPMAAASSISPSGMQLAGKYGMGVLSIASTSQEGLQALPTQWSFAEEAAKKHDQKVDRKNWRVVMAWHLAEFEEAGRAGGGGRPSALAQRVQCPRSWPAWLDPCGRQVGASGANDRHRQCGRHVGHRHTRRDGQDDSRSAGGYRRVRRRAGFRTRLGKSRSDAALVGAVCPLRHSRDQRTHP